MSDSPRGRVFPSAPPSKPQSGHSLPRVPPTPLARAQRVPGARRLPPVGDRSRASPPHPPHTPRPSPHRTSRDTSAYLSAPRALTGSADSAWRTARCRWSAEEPAVRGLGRGRRLRPSARPPRPAWEVGCSGDVARAPSARAESASGGADVRVQVRAGAWAGASRGWGGSGVHGTPGHPWTARLLS